MSTMARKPAGTRPSPLSKKASPGTAQPQQDPYSTSNSYQQKPVAMPSYQSGGYTSYQQPSSLMRPKPGADPSKKSWTPVPGYGFDRSGNQVPVSEGGIFKTPYGATPYEGQTPYQRELELMKAQGRYPMGHRTTRAGEGSTGMRGMGQRPSYTRPTGPQDNSMIGGVPNPGTTAGYWPAGWNGDQVRPDPRDPKTIQQQWLNRVKPEQREQLAELFAQQNASSPPPTRPSAPSQAQPAADPYSYSTPYGQAFTTPGYQPPPPYQQPQPLYGSPMGGFSTQPTTPQRDAFINNLNEQMIPYYTGQASGPPQFNIQQAWDQAGQMVQDGWQNPFAQMLGTLQGQSAPPMYQPSPMMPPPMQPQTGFGQAQQGYTDDEIQRLMRDGDPERGIRPMPGVGLQAAGTPQEVVDRRYQEMQDSWMRANNITPQSTGMGQPVTGWGQGFQRPTPPPPAPRQPPEPSIGGTQQGAFSPQTEAELMDKVQELLSPEQRRLFGRYGSMLKGKANLENFGSPHFNNSSGELRQSQEDSRAARAALIQQILSGELTEDTFKEAQKDWLAEQKAFRMDRREQAKNQQSKWANEKLLEDLMAAPQAKSGHIIVNKQWVPTTPANVQRYYNEGPGLALSNAQKNLMESRIKWSHPAYQGYGF